jgi:hypothetical protein
VAIKKAWRRELLPAEKRVNFKQLEDSWNSAEVALIDDLTPVLIQVIDRLETDLRKILDSENYGELRDLKIGYKDKLVGVFKAHMIEAFKFGKEGVYDEFKIQKTLTIESAAREFIAVKAETIVNDLLDKIKSSALFTALSGIKAGFTTDQIIKEIKGPAFKQQQAEMVTV